MNPVTILKLKQKEGLSARYVKRIDTVKGGSKVVLTPRLEEAKAFESFQEASLFAQRPELNYLYEQTRFYDEAVRILRGL